MDRMVFSSLRGPNRRHVRVLFDVAMLSGMIVVRAIWNEQRWNARNHRKNRTSSVEKIGIIGTDFHRPDAPKTSYFTVVNVDNEVNELNPETVNVNGAMP